MKIDGWAYYNNAAMSTQCPHEEPDTTPITDGRIWSIGGMKPLFARWTSDFNCAEETNWWYIVKFAPYNVEELSAKSRKHIRQAQKKNTVKLIDPIEYGKELRELTSKTINSYEVYTGDKVTEKWFSSSSKTDDFWIAINNETEKIIGYMQCRRHPSGCVETVSAKYDPEYLNLRASDAIHNEILNYYLNENGYRYVNSGSRSIEHDTGSQEYKITNFGFRKAYCKLHIEYRKPIGMAVKLLYPFRKLIGCFKSVGIARKITAVLKMEEIVKKQRKMCK